MLTNAAVDHQAPRLPLNDLGGFISITDLAARRNVTKQAISRRAKAFIKSNRLPNRREGKCLLIHQPTYDALTSETHDPAQDLRNRHQVSTKKAEFIEPESQTQPYAADADLPPADLAKSSTYDAASAREKAASAELKEMALAKAKGELIPVGDVAKAGAQIGEKIRAALASLRSQTTKLYASAIQGGEDALRVTLAQEIGLVERAIANAMLDLASLDD